MHISSMENMDRCYRRFVAGTELESRERVVVLDLGGADVNGSYRDVFRGPQYDYRGADLVAGEGVAIVLESAYEIPLEDASVDIVLSGQMLEHCEFFWKSFEEMVRVLKPSGFIFLIAPSAGPIHRYPVDCYRFYPDAYAALARYTDCEMVDVWMDERGPWNDLTGIFRKKGAPALPAAAQPAHDAEPPFAGRGSDEEEAAKGSVSTFEVLEKLHTALKPESYFEIGARDARGLSLAHCPALGIGPHAGALGALPENIRTVAAASGDFFFEHRGKPALDTPPDLVFLDGARFFETMLLDFMQVERLSRPSTLVVVNNVLPAHAAQGARERRTALWAGDVWKLHETLRRQRPDLVLTLLDTHPTGLLLICGLDPHDDSLWKGYNAVIDEYGGGSAVPPEVLSRAAALAPEPALLSALGKVLRQERGRGPRVFRVRKKLQKLQKLFASDAAHA